jgi:transposase
MSESSCIDSPLRGLGLRRTRSGELQERLIKAMGMSASRRGAAERFDVSASSATKWLQRWRDNGSAAAKPFGGGVSPPEKFAAQILAVIAEQPDRTLLETMQSRASNESEPGAIRRGVSSIGTISPPKKLKAARRRRPRTQTLDPRAGHA